MLIYFQIRINGNFVVTADTYFPVLLRYRHNWRCPLAVVYLFQDSLIARGTLLGQKNLGCTSSLSERDAFS